ncbi:MAG: hypothetical protein DI531_04830 [Brevundimonas sp.]|nr:MAG: hypothetical protein DI531_04830 [Brevundimonas sp.]
MMGTKDATVAAQKRMRPGGDQGHRRGSYPHVQMPQGFNIVLNLPAGDERLFGGTGVRRAPKLTKELIFSCDAIGKIGHAQETEIKVFLIAGEEALVFCGFDFGDRQNGQASQIQRLARCSAVSTHLLIVISHAGHASS